VRSKDLDLTVDATPAPEIRLAQLCAKCGQEINTEHRRSVLAMLKLFGMGHGWRLCDCKQSLLKGWGPKKQIFDPLKQDWPPWK
jgi:hypothetical protein